MNVNSLIHHSDFDLETQALGKIRIGPMSDAIKEIFKSVNSSENHSNSDIARKIILSIGRKITNDQEIDKFCGGPSLTEDEVLMIDGDELDDFSSQFVTRRLTLSKKEETIEPSSNEGKSPIDLKKEISNYLAEESAFLQRIISSTNKNSFFDTASKAMQQGNAITEALKKLNTFGGISFSDHKLETLALNDAKKTVTAFEKPRAKHCNFTRRREFTKASRSTETVSKNINSRKSNS